VAPFHSVLAIGLPFIAVIRDIRISVVVAETIVYRPASGHKAYVASMSRKVQVIARQRVFSEVMDFTVATTSIGSPSWFWFLLAVGLPLVAASASGSRVQTTSAFPIPLQKQQSIACRPSKENVLRLEDDSVCGVTTVPDQYMSMHEIRRRSKPYKYRTALRAYQ
jgi:hypothetical protein